MENKKPCPRLELNWVKTGKDWSEKECIYSLVIPLGEYDIRHDNDNVVNGEMFLEIGRTKVTGSNTKPTHDGIVSTPYRDGAHGYWDSLALNGIPVIAVCCEHWNVIDYGDRNK